MGVSWRGLGIVGMVGLIGGSTLAASASNDPPAVELRVITFDAIDRSDLDLTRDTVQTVFGRAGIQVSWRECAGDACNERSSGRPFLLVRLLPSVSASNPSAGGDVIRDQATKEPGVLVYLRRNIEVAWMVRRSPSARSNPSIATLALGHVVGLTVAHELGHALGLGHRPKGLMKPLLAPEDFIAFRRAKLGFTQAESERMRTTLMMRH